MKKSYEIDMCNGPLLGKILVFSIPLMLSGILQLLFNAADIIVVGRFAGSTALAAVGSTASLINLMINVFVGLSVGVNVLAARYYGAQKEKDIQDTVHTAIMMAILSGLFLVVLGESASKPMLTLMGTPDDVLDQAALYLRIYFFGMPVLMIYNFGAALLRAVGDTRRPLYFLFAAGAVNVVLNLFFVIQLGMGVDGVAWATVISECVSAGLIIRSLMKENGAMKLHLTKLRIVSGKLTQIVRVGLPAGMQGAIFSISNVLIQLGMGVDGVAWATVISECVSAGLIIRSLMKENGAMKLHLTKLRIVSGKLTQIVRVGLPAGMQGAIFSISNVLIQSSVNSFGSIAMAGNTASSNIEGFVYTAMNAVYQTSLSFTSQNLGGEKFM